VEDANHGLELLHGLSCIIGRAESSVGSKEGNGVVAPVVFLSGVDQMLVVDVKVNGHELHSGDSQFLEMGDDWLECDGRVSASEMLGNDVVEIGHSLDVSLIDDSLMPGDVGRRIVGPGEGSVDNRGQGTVGSIIVIIEIVVVREAIAKHRLVPLHVSGHSFGIGVQDHLVSIESMTIVRLIWPVNSKAIQLSGATVRQVAMEDM